MKIDGTHYRTVWLESAAGADPSAFFLRILDQTRLPWGASFLRLETLAQAAYAIRSMQVRGAPLIGAVAAYGLCLALREDASDAAMARDAALLNATRPTAINLGWAIARMQAALRPLPPIVRLAAALHEAAAICDEDVAQNAAIGQHGLRLIGEIAARHPGRPVQILTHCNAGWLATVDWGTAISPIYAAHDAGIAVHVWVDETRPRNQGAALTAWELGQHGVPHTLVVDNAGGHLMQRGDVDLVIVGTDRVARNGDVANKIGTYLKALAAQDNGVPFWVALPSTTIDWNIASGHDIPIEERDASEVTTLTGRNNEGAIMSIRITPDSTPAANPAFDVTPARLVSGLITERGCCAASADGLARLFPEHRRKVA